MKNYNWIMPVPTAITVAMMFYQVELVAFIDY